jgi:hypothetical protein
MSPATAAKRAPLLRRPGPRVDIDRSFDLITSILLVRYLH